MSADESWTYWVPVTDEVFQAALTLAAKEGDLSEPIPLVPKLTTCWYWSVNMGLPRPIARQDTREEMVYYHLSYDLHAAVSRQARHLADDVP